MFLDLPNDLQENIFDRLHIKDRIKLNAAIPKASKITRTIKTDQRKDKKLGIAYHYFKKKKDKFTVCNNLCKFIQSNRDDPTCSEIVNELFPNKSGNDSCDAAVFTLQQDLSNNTINFETFDKLPEVLKFEQIIVLRNEILRSKKITFESFQKMIEYPSALNVLKQIFSGFDIFFHIVNETNEIILIDVLKHKDVLGINQAQYEHITSKTYASIFNRKQCMEMIIKYFNISYDVQQAWLEKAFESFDTETINWLMIQMGVQL
jgi:hypothetical protein